MPEAADESMTPTAELVNPDRFAAWAADKLPGSGPVEVERHAAGHSNLTFVVRRVGEPTEWILRRPPQGPLLPTAHDVLREYRVLDLLARGGGVRVPQVTAACEDLDVIGVPFYLMERVAGTVVRETLPAWLDDDTRDQSRRHTLSLDLAEALAELHTAPYQPLVDAGIGKPEGYLRRQLRRWRGQREGVQAAAEAAGATARELPDYDALRDWLEANVPDEIAPAVVHGDYKLDNVIVNGSLEADDDARVVTIVDWEMATVGDPRADLGYLMYFWVNEGERMPWHELVTSQPGFATREEMVAQWEKRTGIEVDDLTWFVTLAGWKLAILLEASYYRHLAGTTDDPFFAQLEQGVPALLATARERAGV
jgi:aminoglycoside phosphotransferase (APT) family kinase protein